MKEDFDLASYPKSRPFNDPTSNKVVGKVKDEAIWQSISEFVRLKPNMSSYQSLEDPSYGEAGFITMKRAKGINSAAVGKLRHDQNKV